MEFKLMLSGFLRYDQLLTFLSSRNVNDNEVHYLGLLYFNFGCANIEIDIKLWNFEWVKRVNECEEIL